MSVVMANGECCDLDWFWIVVWSPIDVLLPFPWLPTHEVRGSKWIEPTRRKWVLGVKL